MYLCRTRHIDYSLEEEFLLEGCGMDRIDWPARSTLVGEWGVLSMQTRGVIFVI